MRVLIILLVLASSMLFAQDDNKPTVTKYRINFSQIEENLEAVSEKLDEGEALIPKQTYLNFHVLLELGNQMEKILRHDGSELTEQELEDFKLLVQEIKNQSPQSQDVIVLLELLLEKYREMDIVFLPENTAIKFVDGSSTRSERKPFKKINFKVLKNILRAKGGVSSGGGG